MTRTEFDKTFNEKYDEHFHPKEITEQLKKCLEDSKKQNSEATLDDFIINLFVLCMSKNKEFIYSLLTDVLPISD